MQYVILHITYRHFRERAVLSEETKPDLVRFHPAMTNILPDLPPNIDGPSAWYGPAMALSREWIEQLSDAEITEIELATVPLADSSIDIPSLRREDFPLPTLSARLQQIL